ncbi:MAG: DNA recombination protein RmuC, partial [Actinomycetota bacterium]|nr:DNA recombination protein RmuC [Actinomycetota bacterium]
DQAVRQAMEGTRAIVHQLRVQAEERRHGEASAWEAVRRLEDVLLGAGSRGRAGENVLHEALAHLPAGMVVRDFRVNGAVVEFALVLPDGRRLPVDSKWAALREVEELAAEEDPSARERLCRAVERAVAARAREVEAYLDPSMTTPFAVACVPDAAYEVCRKAHADAYARGVVLVPYSTALPVLLSLFALAARFGAAADAQASLAELDTLLSAMEQTLENKVTRATTMLQNASDEWRRHMGRARGAIARGRGVGLDAGDDDSEPALSVVPGARSS